MSSFEHTGEYRCICGKMFTNSQSFNGHKSHCNLNFESKNKDLKKIDSIRVRNRNIGFSNNRKKKEKEQIEKWISEHHTCERCGKVMTEYYGSGRFCSRSCANCRCHSEETREKITVSSDKARLKIKSINREIYYKSPNKCVICNNVIPYEKRNRKTCCKDCYAVYDREIQKRFSPVQRSKNEIDFCNMCIDFFGADNVVNNEKMFNGWDADVIIPKYKIAVLWNGPWHYKKITKNQKFEQIKNRDKIKLEEIKKFGYVPYIIQDMGQQNHEKVIMEFGVFLDYLIDSHVI